MNRRSFLCSVLWAFFGLGLAACNVIAAPTMSPTPTVASSSTISKSSQSLSSSSTFATKTNSGGSVVVEVTPQTLGVGQPIAFEIAMNTHSVDLSDDMTQIVTLRDDQGKEYTPTAWEGAGPGGHHRNGVLKFAALTSKPKSIDLVIKGLAKVSERTFHWDLP